MNRIQQSLPALELLSTIQKLVEIDSDTKRSILLEMKIIKTIQEIPRMIALIIVIENIHNYDIYIYWKIIKT
jgi:hypothetical protein